MGLRFPGRVGYSIVLSILSAFLAMVRPAMAIPAFAAQTGMTCADCHMGFQELNPVGRQFKLQGYVWGGSTPKLDNFAAFVQAGYTYLHQKVPGGLAPDYPSNNVWSVQQTSLFYGGALEANIGLGASVQGTYDGVAHEFSWDNTDIRLSQHAKLDNVPIVYGFTFNNAPSVTDLWNTLPSWGYPFIFSGLAVGNNTGIQIGALAQEVAGAGVYTALNPTPQDMIYSEFDLYKALPNHAAFALGVGPEDPIAGPIPYWRLAMQHTTGPNSIEIGTSGLVDHPYPSGFSHGPTDTITDLGVDAEFQHIDQVQAISFDASYYHEDQHFGASQPVGGTANVSDSLDTETLTATYLWHQLVGITESYNAISGNADPVLYAPDPIDGSANGKPNTDSFTTELDYYPFNHGGPKFFPWVDAKFFVQGTIYPYFNGSSRNYDGAGRAAQDNNILFTGIWLAF